MFSRFSTRLAHHPARTLPEMISQLQQATTPSPEVIEVSKVAAAAEWLETCTVWAGVTLQNIHVIIRSKEWPTDDNWSPGHVVIVDAPCGLPMVIPQRPSN